MWFVAGEVGPAPGTAKPAEECCEYCHSKIENAVGLGDSPFGDPITMEDRMTQLLTPHNLKQRDRLNK